MKNELSELVRIIYRSTFNGDPPYHTEVKYGVECYEAGYKAGISDARAERAKQDKEGSSAIRKAGDL